MTETRHLKDTVLPDGRTIKELRVWKDMRTLYKEVLVIPIGKQPYRHIIKKPLTQGLCS